MEKVAVEVICFAGLRKFFGSGLRVSVESGAPWSEVIAELVRKKPDAKEVLSACRLAVNEEFISPEETIQSERTLILIPPSSGG
jgi:molybdopterin synthase sulfur carrier subunit